MKTRWLAALLLMLGGAYSLPAQQAVVGASCPASGQTAIATNGTPVLCTGSPLVWTGIGGSGGASSPTSLTSYFNGYTGVSPKDCSTSSCNTPGVGAFGDWHAFFDCTISAGQAVENCTGSHFTSTAVDGGKTAELECNNAIVVTTISSVQSATQATLGATCSVTQTNTYFAFGHDDTNALRNWATFINSSFSSTSTSPSVRAGYLPRGIYYTTKAIRFIWPGAVQPAGDHTTGECAKISGATIWCPLVLTGDGTWASEIVGASNFNWAADGTSTNTGLCYFNNWSGSYINNMGCGWAAQQESGFSTNTTGQTGLVGTWVFDNDQHTKWDSNFAAGGHCTGGTVCAGLVIDKDFESSYSNSALEFNDIQLWINPSTGNNTYEKIVFDTLFCEGGGGANGNIQINTNSALKQVTFRNVHSRDGTASFNIRTGVTTSGGDALVLERFRQTTSVAGANQGLVIQSAMKLECDNCYFEDTGGTAGAVLFTITQSAEVDLYGGGMFGSSMTNAINVSGGTPTIYDYGVRRTGITNLCTGTCTSVNALEPTATGWTGPGGILGTYFGSAGATPTLSAGTGACATTSTQVGGPWSGTFVCTGTTGASTITIAPGSTAAHGWNCSSSDQTAGVVGAQSGSSATTCTIKFASVTQNDVITFQAAQY